jgi:predicted MFS family arabinose efflux permease
MTTMAAAMPSMDVRATQKWSDRWIAFISSFLGYIFDVFDLSLFTFVWFRAIGELLDTTDTVVIFKYVAYILAAKLLFWSLGGPLFGIIADRWGRKSALIITVAGYSALTAASGFATSYMWLFVLQAASALCISGEWVSSMAIVAETWNGKKKVYAGVTIQSAFAIGSLLASVANLYIGALYGWRALLLFGALPAFFLVAIRALGLKDPEPWIHERESGHTLGAWQELFSPTLRRRTALNFIIVTAFLIAWWGGNAMLPATIIQFVVQDGGLRAQGIAATSEVFNLIFACSLPGYVLLAYLASEIGRKIRPLYVLYAISGLAASLYLFLRVTTLHDLKLLAPVYGLTVIAGFGIFGVFLPKSFPTRLRGVGLGVTYNGGRAITGGFVLLQPQIVDWFGSVTYVGAVASLAYIVAIAAVQFLPEDAPEE